MKQPLTIALCNEVLQPLPFERQCELAADAILFVRGEDARAIGAVFGARVLHGPVSRIPLRTRSSRTIPANLR